MTTSVFALLLLGAALHATWNALVKSGQDKLLSTVLIATSAALMSALMLPFVEPPAAASWPYIALSAGVQVIYYLFLAAAYRAGDMSQAYPLMRGSAPLLVAIASGPLIGESLSSGKWLGVALICGGVLSLARARRGVNANHAVVIYGLTNAVFIAIYSLLDGIGVRKSGSATAYTMWNFIATALLLLGGTLLRRPAELAAYARGRLGRALIGGAATLASYGIALWAMTQAPVAVVAALRETSMIFGTLIAVLVLKERASWQRFVAIAVIALGAATIRLL